MIVSKQPGGDAVDRLVSALLRWARVPAGLSDEELFEFAGSYDGYLLHGPGFAEASRSLRHVMTGSFELVNRNAPTEDLRGALFLIYRFTHDSGDMARCPATVPLLRELAARQRHGYLSITRGDISGAGYVPAPWRLPDWLSDSVSSVVLRTALTLGEHFSDGELAWLAATSKAEHALRDRWGWLLQQLLIGTEFAVAREWRQADLVILHDNHPAVVIEGKAMYGFDALSTISRAKFIDLVRADIAKATALAPDAYVLASVLMTTVVSPWSSESNSAIAYPGNKKTAAMGPAAAEQARSLMWQGLTTVGQVGVVRIDDDQAFGSMIDTTLFLVRPRDCSCGPMRTQSCLQREPSIADRSGETVRSSGPGAQGAAPNAAAPMQQAITGKDMLRAATLRVPIPEPDWTLERI